LITIDEQGSTINQFGITTVVVSGSTTG
jgi:hypothetical protein